MMEHRVSFRYARALLDSAKKEGVTDIIFNDFLQVKRTFEMSRELRQLAASPVIQILRKKKILNLIFKEIQISDLTLSFIIFLIDKRRGNLMLSIISEYELQYNLLNNRIQAEIVSAVKLDENMQNMVVKKISDRTHMTVLPDYIVDKTIKGGILVRIGDWVFDASIKNQLETLQRKLVEG